MIHENTNGPGPNVSQHSLEFNTLFNLIIHKILIC